MKKGVTLLILPNTCNIICATTGWKIWSDSTAVAVACKVDLHD